MNEILSIDLAEEPDSSSIVFVFGLKSGSGVSHVVKSLRSKYPLSFVKDNGIEPPSIESIGENDHVVFVTERREVIPDSVHNLSKIKQVEILYYSEIRYDDMEWELMQTNHALLKELEKLLPEDNQVLLMRNEIRSKYATVTVPQEQDQVPSLEDALR